MKQAVFCLLLLVSCTSGSLATPPAAAKEEIGVRETEGLSPEHELLYQQMLRYHRITHDRTFRAANPQQETETARERTALRKQLIPQIATVFAPLAEGILPPFGKQLLTDPKTRHFCRSVLVQEISSYPPETRQKALELIFEASPEFCRGRIVLRFLRFAKIDPDCFHSPPIQNRSG